MVQAQQARDKTGEGERDRERDVRSLAVSSGSGIKTARCEGQIIACLFLKD